MSSNSAITTPYGAPSLENPNAIAALYPHKPQTFDKVLVPQIEERIQLVQRWDIQPGEHVLEIGCGQGDCTIVLATAVGETGSVTAVDPADLDYGNPYTLGQAQEHLRKSPLGARITFVQADPVRHLEQSGAARYTTAVLAHSIWYFASPSVLGEILSALKTRAERVCIAEYALVASDPRATPHVLATFAQAALECHKPTSTSNIRTVLSPEAIRGIARSGGWTLVKEETIVPPEGMLDGHWESTHVLSDEFVEDAEENIAEERIRGAVVAMRDAVHAARDGVLQKGEKVTTMDVWVASFGR